MTGEWPARVQSSETVLCLATVILSQPSPNHPSFLLSLREGERGRSTERLREVFFNVSSKLMATPSQNSGGNILALAVLCWLTIITHGESDAFQGLKIDYV